MSTTDRLTAITVAALLTSLTLAAARRYPLPSPRHPNVRTTHDSR